MADLTFNELMTAHMDAVRAKSGVTGKLSIAAATEAVNSITVGSSDIILPDGITVTPSDVKDGVFYIDSEGEKQEGTMTIHGAKTVTLTTNEQILPAGYYDSVTIPGSVFASLTSQQIELATSDGSYVLEGQSFITGLGTVEQGTMPNNGILEITPTESVQEYPRGYYGSITVEAVEKVDEDLCSVTFGVVDDNGNFEPLDITVTPPEKLADANAMPEIVIYQTNRAEPSIDGDSGEKFYFCATTIEYKYEDFIFDDYYFSTAFGIRVDEVGGDRLDRTWQGFSSSAYPYYIACQYAEDQKIWYIGSLNNKVYGDTTYIKRWYPSKAFAMAFAEADQSKSIFEQNWKRHTTRRGTVELVDGYNLKFSYWGNTGTLASYINFEQNTVRGYGHFVGYVASGFATNEGQEFNEYTIEPRQNGEAYYWVMYWSGVTSPNGEYTAISGESREPLYVSETFSLAEWKHFVDVKWQKCKVNDAGTPSEWFDLDMETTALETPLEDKTYTKTFWAGFPMIREGKSFRHDGVSNVDPDLVDLTGAEMFPVDSDGLIPSPGEVYNEDCTMKIGEYIPYQPMGNEPEEAGE